MTTERSALEDRVVAAARARRDDSWRSTSELVALDTTARDAGAPPRDEARLQRLLAARLAALGAEIDLWEPEPTGAGGRFVPPDLDFVGRPQLVARLAGDPGGRPTARVGGPTAAPAPDDPAAPARDDPAEGPSRSLLLTGHIDAVGVEPREQWDSDPFVVTERDGLLFGRGTNDMKGGLAALVVALEALRDAGVTLAGEVVFAAVTDEESSGMGSWSVVQRFAERGLQPQAGLCAEPTGFEAWVACRGILKPRLTIPGRAGHSQQPQPDWRAGGAVNAIERLVPVLGEVAASTTTGGCGPTSVIRSSRPATSCPCWLTAAPGMSPIRPSATSLSTVTTCRGSGTPRGAPISSRPRSGSASTRPPRPTTGWPSTRSAGGGSGRCRRPRSPPIIRWSRRCSRAPRPWPDPRARAA